MIADLEVEPIENLLAVLSPTEVARADRFHFPRDRRRYVVSQSLLRHLLGSYLEVAPDGIRFDTLPRGKPVLADGVSQLDLRFNLAHSGERAAYAFSVGRDVGIDLEQVERRDFEGLVERFFAGEEAEALAGLAGEDWLTGFFNCWTRKEAVLKWRGDGLMIPLDQFVVTLRPDEAPGVVRASSEISDVAQVELTALDAGPGYIGALAAIPGARVVEFDVLASTGGLAGLRMR